MDDGSGKFNDPEFPPVAEVLLQGDGRENFIDLFPEEVDMLKEASFKRASDVYRNLVVFNGIDPNDIV